MRLKRCDIKEYVKAFFMLMLGYCCCSSETSLLTTFTFSHRRVFTGNPISPKYTSPQEKGNLEITFIRQFFYLTTKLIDFRVWNVPSSAKTTNGTKTLESLDKEQKFHIQKMKITLIAYMCSRRSAIIAPRIVCVVDMFVFQDFMISITGLKD